jgi:hypothetical protein
MKNARRKATVIPGVSDQVYNREFWQEQKKAADKIVLRFQIDSIDNIGFRAEGIPAEYADELRQYHQSGIEPFEQHRDNLFQGTIYSGHDLLKNNGIFYSNSLIVDPMSKVIGQYLFRLLFGHTQFQDLLRWAYKTRKNLSSYSVLP